MPRKLSCSVEIESANRPGFRPCLHSPQTENSKPAIARPPEEAVSQVSTSLHRDNISAFTPTAVRAAPNRATDTLGGTGSTVGVKTSTGAVRTVVFREVWRAVRGFWLPPETMKRPNKSTMKIGKIRPMARIMIEGWPQ